MLAIWSLIPVFSKSSLNIWKFLVHVLLKPRLEDFEYSLASMWNDCNCVIFWTFFGITLLWDWNENWLLSLLWPLLSFPNLQHHNYNDVFKCPKFIHLISGSLYILTNISYFPSHSASVNYHSLYCFDKFVFFLRFYKYINSYFVWHFTSRNTLKVHTLLWMSEFPSFSGLNHSPHFCYPGICWWTQVDSISWLLRIMLQ